jgi:hypothetical protein
VPKRSKSGAAPVMHHKRLMMDELMSSICTMSILPRTLLIMQSIIWNGTAGIVV